MYPCSAKFVNRIGDDRRESARQSGNWKAISIVEQGDERLKADLFLGLGLRVLGAVSSFGLAWLIASQFGARTVGLYQIGFTTATLFATGALMGLDVILVRRIAPLLQDKRFAQVGLIFRDHRLFILKFGGLLAVACALFSVPFAKFLIGDAQAAYYILALSPLVFLLPVLKLHNALLRSLGLTRKSQSLEGLFYTSLAALLLYVVTSAFSAPMPQIIPLVMSMSVVCAVSLSVWATNEEMRSRALSDEMAKRERLEIWSGVWVAAGPIAGAAGSWLILILIAALLDTSNAGVFRIAVQVCGLMQIINASFATMSGPYLSRAAKDGDFAKLRLTTITAGGIGVLLSLPVFVTALLIPEWIMRLFGEEFVSGAPALAVLVIAQLINVAAGPVGVALVMQNHERTVLWLQICATLAALVMIAALTPTWGLLAPAWAVFVSSLIRNGSNWLAFWWINRRPVKPA